MDSVKTDPVQEKIKNHPKRRFNSTKNQNQNGVKRRKNELITIASQLKAFRRELPIWKERNNIIREIRNNSTVIVMGEMGSGKSTQIPQFLLDAGFTKSAGRQFPVTVHNILEPQPDYLDAALVTTFQIHIEEEPGDILVFLPGQEEIETLKKLIKDYGTTLAADKMKIIPCPMFAALPAEKQAKVFEPAPRDTRKVILATNIAETSITINGDFNCTREAVAVISLLSVDSIFFTPHDKREVAAEAKKKFISLSGDLITMLNVLKAYEHHGDVEWCKQHFINTRNMRQVLEIRRQLKQLCDRMNIPSTSCGSDYDQLIKCLLLGFFRNTALLQPDNTYKTIVGNQASCRASFGTVHIHPSSSAHNKKIEAVMYIELVSISLGGIVFDLLAKCLVKAFL
ncbi:478_t:CDS:2 [Paraglomus occultum]|uniref:RNA helicase n=1 Tax=Paraglomus occultum TaxID=144539 RepID=A0A9N9D4V5_9GLOM|nr:478_t:CDS:2 [Paraglomus occultum]